MGRPSSPARLDQSVQQGPPDHVGSPARPALSAHPGSLARPSLPVQKNSLAGPGGRSRTPRSYSSSPWF